jgi:AcrR family transcriptional regulator
LQEEKHLVQTIRIAGEDARSAKTAMGSPRTTKRRLRRAAGVSHALVTYYFGTYDALVDAVVERRFVALREGVPRGLLRVVGEGGDPLAILAEHRKALARTAADPWPSVSPFTRCSAGVSTLKTFSPREMLAQFLFRATKASPLRKR